MEKRAKKIKSGINKKQELELLREIIETISYNLDLKEVLGRIVKIVSNVTKADSCFCICWTATIWFCALR